MLVVAGIVFAGALAMLAVGWARRKRPGLPLVGESERANVILVVLFGIGIPIVVLVALFIVSNLYVLQKTDAPARGATKLSVTVIGHQWWWEVRYADAGVVTANEIHIPARTPVEVVGTSADVIHSFWVPELNRKIDLIPGRRNRVELYAEHPGRFRGQCAEFCGLQHAHMAFEVVAEPAAGYERWLAAEAEPASPASGAAAREGEQLFMENACASCHTVAGTTAAGTIGPDLTHLASRRTLAADTVPNDPAELRRWISHPQDVKPGNRMPGLQLSDSQFDAIAAYLEGLR